MCETSALSCGIYLYQNNNSVMTQAELMLIKKISSELLLIWHLFFIEDFENFLFDRENIH